MELRHLRYFVAVAQALNFTRAAEKLHTSQPSLSSQIRDLENCVGVPLLVRDKRKVALTAAGECFLQDALVILEKAENAKLRARKIVQEGRQLTIGFVPSAEVDLLPKVLPMFRLRQPDTLIELVSLITTQQEENYLHHPAWSQQRAMGTGTTRCGQHHAGGDGGGLCPEHVVPERHRRHDRHRQLLVGPTPLGSDDHATKQGRGFGTVEVTEGEPLGCERRQRSGLDRRQPQSAALACRLARDAAQPVHVMLRPTTIPAHDRSRGRRDDDPVDTDLRQLLHDQLRAIALHRDEPDRQHG